MQDHPTFLFLLPGGAVPDPYPILATRPSLPPVCYWTSRFITEEPPAHTASPSWLPNLLRLPQLRDTNLCQTICSYYLIKPI